MLRKKFISGRIKDFHSEEGVPFASVHFKGHDNRTVSDSSGEFSFPVAIGLPIRW